MIGGLLKFKSETTQNSTGENNLVTGKEYDVNKEINGWYQQMEK